MSLDLSPAVAAAAARKLQPYARMLLEQSGDHALRLFADAVAPEHLLSTLMLDECSAACAVVLHAFADPETIAHEALAISPGLLVVGSGSTLPFSTRGVAAIFAARELAAREGAPEVVERHVLLAAEVELASPLREALAAEGFDTRSIAAAAATVCSTTIPSSGPLFRHFSSGARRTLSNACRVAAATSHPSIAPGHLLLGCLQEADALAASTGLRFARARMIVGARAADATPPPERLLALDDDLLDFLAGVPAGADSLDLLARYLTGGTPELTQILVRNKLKPHLLDRSRGAFRDPAAP